MAPFDKEIAEIKKKHAKIAKIKADDQERVSDMISTSGFATTHVVVSVRHPITY